MIVEIPIIFWTLISSLAVSSAVDVEYDLIVSDRPLLLLSTLNGTLVAVEKSTGREIWRLEEEPILHDSSGPSYDFNFFPNPKDGSIYALGENDHLERLALSISDLVDISPVQSGDGLLYAGRKVDSWIAVDSVTGIKLHSFASEQVSETCPVSDSQGTVLHIARTAFTVTIFDRRTHVKKWNVTYMEYASNSFKEPSATDFLHFCSNSDGSVLSVDRLTGLPMWRKMYSSPVMGIYSVESGGLRKVPSISVAADSLGMLTGSSILAIRMDTFGIKASDSILQPSLFVGSYAGQVYAVQSLVRETDLKLEFSSDELPLLEGPKDDTNPFRASGDSEEEEVKEYDGAASDQLVEAGHYCLPAEGKVEFQPISKQIDEQFLSLLRHGGFSGTAREDTGSMASAVKPPASPASTETVPLSPATSSVIRSEPAHELDQLPPGTDGLHPLIVPILTVTASAILASIIAITITRLSGRPLQQSSPSRPSANSSPSNSTSSSANGLIGKDMLIEALSPSIEGEVTVGKIKYFSQEVLGHGSEGTMVFKGKFDERCVAVKRLLPECFGFADREVDLLRQSDKHANVVRYYCMEQDASFRYIALELAQATLHEYVTDTTNKFDQSKEQSVNLILEAMKGIAYLHSIGIVHRDIKPRNVLLSFPTSNGSIRAMISDFGLCKKLPHGKMSFTARSGLMGTEGWVAPEVLDKSRRVTFAVDIFSMGCVVYYVLTSGRHPFGSSLRRQANIESDYYDLSDLSGIDECVAADLLKNMISHNSNFRPTAEEVLSHCLFWSEKKQLAFFQDVSDRIEKENSASPIFQALEVNSSSVCCGDWRDVISDELKEDLRKFRSYQGSSVRDLLRAMRNKKHHYRELPEALKKSLGHIPDEFVRYFTSRFPLLLIHTYKKMEICKRERIFRTYYSADFRELYL